MTKLEGKVAVITGGDSGIGLATAWRFVSEGAYVYITGRSQRELDAAVRQIGKHVTAVQGDVSQLADLDRLYATVKQQHGRLDIVFANAGIGEFAALGEISEAHFDNTFNINVKGLLFTVQKALPLLQDGGSIILLGTVCIARPRLRSAHLRAVGPWTCKPARSASTPSALVQPTPRASVAWGRLRNRGSRA